MQQRYGCPKCRKPVAYGTRFCENCLAPLSWSAHQQMQPPPVYQQQQTEALSQEENEAQHSAHMNQSIWPDALQEARNEAGTKDIGCGFLLLVAGVVITLVTLAVTEPGGHYYLMWGSMAFGAFYIIRGLYRKITSNINTGIRLGWILGVIILVCGIVGGGMVISNTLMPAPPSESFIVWGDNSAWDETTHIFEANGTVTNIHSEWSIKDVNLRVVAKDAAGNTVKTFLVPAVPSKIMPGENGVYNQTLQAPSSCVEVVSFLKCTWAPP